MISIKCEDANSDTCVPMFFFYLYHRYTIFFKVYLYLFGFKWWWGFLRLPIWSLKLALFLKGGKLSKWAATNSWGLLQIPHCKHILCAWYRQCLIQTHWSLVLLNMSLKHRPSSQIWFFVNWELRTWIFKS